MTGNNDRRGKETETITMKTTMVTNIPPERCPGGRREVVSDSGHAVMVTCRCGKHPPGPEKASNEEEVIQVGGKIRTATVDDALRRTERPAAPATALEKEIAAELSRPGNERVLAKVSSEGGEVGSFMAPVPAFSTEWYEAEMRKKRERHR
ncbi:MAG: hypothetical protein ACYSVY_01080 [Planctomycetota bacterium]|jgi:hypothetical protein